MRILDKAYSAADPRFFSFVAARRSFSEASDFARMEVCNHGWHGQGTAIFLAHESPLTATQMQTWRPFENLRREVDRLFEDFILSPFRLPFRRPAFGIEPFWAPESWVAVPAVDFVEKDNAYEVHADLPGMDEKDIEVKVANGVLTIKGQKEEAKEEKKEDYHLRERHYGSCERALRVPDAVDTDKIAATFKKGVLTVTLPKSAEAQKLVKKIEVRASDRRGRASRDERERKTRRRLLLGGERRSEGRSDLAPQCVSRALTIHFTLRTDSKGIPMSTKPAAVSLSDVLGLSRLLFDAADGVTGIVEQMHNSILATPGVDPIGQGVTGGVTQLVYRGVRGAFRLTGKGIGGAAALVDAKPDDPPTSRGREVALARLNGVVGDHLASTGNPLALPMRFRRGGRALKLDRASLAEAFPDATGKLAVLVHGLCLSDLQWTRQNHDHGAALAHELGYTPVYLSYNSGLHISVIGRAFADALEAARTRGKERVIEGLIEAGARRQPLLVTVEDIHWADAGTLSLLGAVARATTRGRAALIMTTRIEGDPLDAGWRAMTADSFQLTIHLSPLAQSEAQTIAKRFPAAEAFAAKCVERAGGNPLFLEQLLRTAGDLVDGKLPNSIQSVVLARTDLLAANDRRAIEAASVLGQRFTLANLRALIGDQRYTGEALLRNALLRPVPDGLQFAHALVRDGVYASLTRARRRQLHDLAARVFVDDPLLRAEHLDLADNPEAPRAYLAASRDQSALFRQDQAVALASRGLAIAVEPRDRVDLAFSSATCSCTPGAVSTRSKPIEARSTRAGRNRTGDER